MPESPQISSPNTLTVDFADAPDVREIFGRKEVGDHCTIKVELQIISKYPEGIQAIIEKIIAEGGYGGDEKEIEAKPDNSEPVMMTMKSRKMKTRGMAGPHETEQMKGGPKSRPAQTAQNSAEPWMTSYV